MLVSAVVCPHPPLLVPALARRESPDLARLRAACVAAVEPLRAAAPELLVVVGAGESDAEFASGARCSFAAYGADLTVSLPGSDGVPSGGEAPAGGGEPPLSVAVGAWLLDTTGWSGPVTGVTASGRSSLDERMAAGAELVHRAERVAVLVMGDLSACRTDASPRPFDPRAEAFDAEVVAAIRGGDPEAVGAIDVELAARLDASGIPALQVLAGAAEDAVFDTEVLYDAAPFGVGYLVAVWERHG